MRYRRWANRLLFSLLTILPSTRGLIAERRGSIKEDQLILAVYKQHNTFRCITPKLLMQVERSCWYVLSLEFLPHPLAKSCYITPSTPCGDPHSQQRLDRPTLSKPLFTTRFPQERDGWGRLRARLDVKATSLPSVFIQSIMHTQRLSLPSYVQWQTNISYSSCLSILLPHPPSVRPTTGARMGRLSGG